MKRARQHLTYANVMSTVGIFLLLGGASAFAANQLAKKSVGTKQLKANAVTTAKIKKNAVTKAKIKDGAVDGAKVADGSLTETEINLGAVPFSRIVHEARGSSTVPASSTPTAFPLSNPNYTQAAGEDDSFVGAIDFKIPASCKEDRTVEALLLVDGTFSLASSEEDLLKIASVGVYSDDRSDEVSGRINIGPYIYGGVRFQQPTATNHTLNLYVVGICKTGGGITVSNGAVDVIGVR